MSHRISRTSTCSSRRGGSSVSLSVFCASVPATLTADSLTPFELVESVLFGVGVTVGAGLHEAVMASAVLSRSDWFEVSRCSHACLTGADRHDVIDVEASRDRSDPQFVGEPMSTDLDDSAVLAVGEPSIPVPLDLSSPQPARWREVDLADEPLLQWYPAGVLTSRAERVAIPTELGVVSCTPATCLDSRDTPFDTAHCDGHGADPNVGG